MTDVETRFSDPKTGDRRLAVWRDKAGVMHRAVGAYVHRDIRLLWTACEKKDIPANGAWLQNPGDNVTCLKCVGDKYKRCKGMGLLTHRSLATIRPVLSVMVKWLCMGGLRHEMGNPPIWRGLMKTHELKTGPSISNRSWMVERPLKCERMTGIFKSAICYDYVSTRPDHTNIWAEK